MRPERTVFALAMLTSLAGCYAEPGSLLIGRFRDFCRTLPNQDEITVHGDHFVQEDAPAEIGRPLQHFLRRVTT